MKDHLPEEVYWEVQAAGEYFDDLHLIFGDLFQKIHDDVPKLLERDREKISREINGVAVIAVQTFGHFLGFNPNYHILVTDGCFYGKAKSISSTGKCATLKFQNANRCFVIRNKRSTG